MNAPNLRSSPASVDGPPQLREDPPPAATPVPQDALDLFRLLAERRVDYLLVGGLAMLTYVKGRNTKDVDLLLSLEASHQIPELEIRERQDFFARAQFRSVQVDLLFTFNPLFKTVAEKFAAVHSFAELNVPAATVEGLIVLKLYALPSLYRQFQMDRAALYENDITMQIVNHSPTLMPLITPRTAGILGVHYPKPNHLQPAVVGLFPLHSETAKHGKNGERNPVAADPRPAGLGCC